ncbi:MAG: carbonic anhydrase [Gemmatimonadaceae bacterium]|nr:carbonic anhydrase [Gemmatimonadaceae bacterium]
MPQSSQPLDLGPAASRRGFLAHAASLGAAAAIGTAFMPRPLAAEELTSAEWDAVHRDPTTPAEALKQLEDGNRRFVAGRPIAPHRDMARLKAIAPRQSPFAAFLGCADSRVPIEIVFDQGFGDVFVSRIAGNIAVAEQIASLEFGTAVLGAKVLYVLGHSACGAVSATMNGTEVPGQISALYFHIRPATRGAGGNLDKAIAANVREQALRLRDGSTVISKLVKEEKLIVAGGVYDLNTGAVTPVALDAA